MKTVPSIDPRHIHAVIFDMDGVITDTARVHARAWKEIFDEFLREHARAGGSEPAEFTMDDYLRHVDGKPRLDGVRDFLAARGITLPEGKADDDQAAQTVHGIGRRKDARFHELLTREGVSAFADTVALIDALRGADIRVAAISSSRNADAVLRAAGLRERFEVLIDGRVAAERGIAGKPEPAIFLEAASELGVEPGNAAIVEDAIAGVTAGRRGGFALVIGVARNDDTDALAEAGADVVLASLERVAIGTSASAPALRRRDALPDALAGSDAMFRTMSGKRLRIFLDYDGTVTPIVSRPEDAVLSGEMRRCLQRLAARHFLAIVSGRSLEELRERVGLEEVVYAGSHGFEVLYPDGSRDEHPQARAAIPELERLAEDLRSRLGGLQGLQLERKRFGLAVHYRRVAATQLDGVERAVAEAQARSPSLRIKAGKKVFEFLPNIDWDKGKALAWILERLDGGLPRPGGDVLPIYIGDDVTDEDAFGAIAGQGLAIAVGDGPEETAARWKLDDVDAVGVFLGRLAEQRPA